jgi:hypothetical protein
MNGTWGAVIVIVLLAAACGGVSQSEASSGRGEPRDGGGGEGSGGRSGGGGATGGLPNLGGAAPGGAVGIGGLPGAGGGGGPGFGGAGGAEGHCVVTDDHADIQITIPEDAGTADPRGALEDVFSGKVVAVASDHFEVDTCLVPDAGCPYLPVRSVRIAAAGLDLHYALAEGALVRVHYKEVCVVGCGANILVSSLLDLDGLTNPHHAVSGVYVAAGESFLSPLPEAPFTISQELVPCHMDLSSPPCGGSDQLGAYALTFKSQYGGWTTTVHMGESASFHNGSAPIRVHDLRSYESGACDAFDFAYWAASPLDWEPAGD